MNPLSECSIGQVDYGGKQPLYYREGTSDVTIINAVLGEKSEYHIPIDLKPKLIWDVGANIGVVAVAMACRFPDAKIICFEPEPNNYQMLVKNTKAYPNILRNQIALGNVTGETVLYPSDNSCNLGGFSLYPQGCDPSLGTEVLVKTPEMLFSSGFQIPDLIKLDCEGSEYDIIENMHSCSGLRAEFIIGEAHGINDFDMFKILSENYELGINKPMADRNYVFYARLKKRSPQSLGM